MGSYQGWCTLSELGDLSQHRDSSPRISCFKQRSVCRLRSVNEHAHRPQHGPVMLLHCVTTKQSSIPSLLSGYCSLQRFARSKICPFSSSASTAHTSGASQPFSPFNSAQNKVRFTPWAQGQGSRCAPLWWSWTLTRSLA